MAPLPGSNSTAQRASAPTIRSAIAANTHHLPLVSLWGMQFAAAAMLGQLYLFRVPAWTVPASFWLAFAATALHVIYYGLVAKRQQPAMKSAIPPRAASPLSSRPTLKSSRPTKSSQSTLKPSQSTLKPSHPHPTFSLSRPTFGLLAVLGLLLLLPVVLLLVSPPGVVLYTELYRALVLAGLYLLLGRYLSRKFTALALWLVLLAGIIAWAYLGFAPFALGLMSGLSLIACHLLLRRA